MSYQRIQVIACTVTGSLPGLSHDVSHIDNRGTGIDQRFPHAADQQVGYHARIETSWAQYHHIRLSDTFQCQGKRSAIRRLQPDAAHRTRGSADAGLSLYISAILQMGMKSHVMCRTGKHSPSDSQDLAGLPHCFVEVSKNPVSYTHLRAHETKANLVCRLLLEKKQKKTPKSSWARFCYTNIPEDSRKN